MMLAGVHVRGLNTGPDDDMVRVFRGEEFDRSPSTLGRWWASVRSFFSGLSFDWLGPVGRFVAWMLLVVAVMALLRWVWTRRHRWVRRRSDVESHVVPITVDLDLDPEELHAEREARQRERDFKAAILVRYREVVLALMRARLVSTEPGRTTGELRDDVASTRPDLAVAFSEATALFEVTWYARHPSTEAEFDRLDRLADDVTGRMTASPAGAGR